MWPFKRRASRTIKSDAHRVVIIGNGVTGVTAAFELRKLRPDWRITIVSGESEFHYSRPALMYIYMGHMTLENTQPFEDDVWDLNNIERVKGWVNKIDTDAKRLDFDVRESLEYDQLLIATGSQSNKFGWPGQDLDRVQGLYGLEDLAKLEEATPDIEHGVIVGGGLIGIELAEMLHSRGKRVTIVARESAYWNNALPDEEAKMINRAIREAGIGLMLQTELEEIVDDGNGRACGITTKDGHKIDCQFVGLTAGVRPNIAVARDTPIEAGRGILVDRSLRTNVADVFAAGDCAEIKEVGDARNTIEQLWYTGKMQARIVAQVMTGAEQTYERGIWYNSAKFLDLEWHTYGRVTPGIHRRPPGERHYWWESDNRQHGLRLVERDGAVIGMNAMGLRHRHQVWERWIAEGRSVDFVLEHLGEANFDPEFYRTYESSIAQSIRGQKS